MNMCRGRDFLCSNSADDLKNHGCDEHEANAGEDAPRTLHPSGGRVENRGQRKNNIQQRSGS